MSMAFALFGTLIVAQPTSMAVAVTPAATPTTVASAKAQAIADRDAKMRCKRYIQTGTLARTIQECHTVGQWRELTDNARRNATRYQDDGAITTLHSNQ